MTNKNQTFNKKILVPHGVIGELAALFNTSYPTVRGALGGKTRTDLQRKIRFTAVERFGGVEMDTRVIKIKRLV